MSWNRTAAALALLLGVLPAWGQDRRDDRRSGFEFMTPQTQAMQRDDLTNPGMLWVLGGETIWKTKAGTSGKSCADCHAGEASMKGVAARYPAFDARLGRPTTLQDRINQCRRTNQGAAPFALEGEEMLSISAYVGHQSRGMPITVGDDPRLASFITQGERLFEARMGQLNLSCAGCHEQNWGKRLGGSLIPQGHPTGYPLYRLEWQGMGSLQRRLRNCMVGVRAEPFAFGSPEFTALELFLMSRAKGMPIEIPAVRP